uniref:hypothetical protein n=1 Tax=Agaricus bitorquis TaxID=5343 RepID=UPI0027A81DF8|nr:hypothetical protein QLP03_mgp041 [Agaricus bitorquis]WFG54027.1 hypothetical protein [Agaricus bitorquis]
MENIFNLQSFDVFIPYLIKLCFALAFGKFWGKKGIKVNFYKISMFYLLMAILSKELYLLDSALAFLTDYNLICNMIPNSINNSASASPSNLSATASEAGDTVLAVAAMKAGVEIGQICPSTASKLGVFLATTGVGLTAILIKNQINQAIIDRAKKSYNYLSWDNIGETLFNLGDNRALNLLIL